MANSNKSIIFFTTQASATGSMMRVYTPLIEGRYQKQLIGWKYRGNREEIRKVDLEQRGKFIIFNLPQYFNKNLNLSKYRFIINYRDPRDRVCNQFHWGKVHPKPDGSTDHLEERARLYDSMGIDEWALRNPDKSYYDNVIWLLDNLPEDQYMVQSYAKICLNFDGFVGDAMDFLGVDEISPEVRNLIELNRVENLVKNSEWIGHKWPEGSDTAPGRYKKELKPDTVRKLTSLFGDVLVVMAKYDPAYAHTYLD